VSWSKEKGRTRGRDLAARISGLCRQLEKKSHRRGRREVWRLRLYIFQLSFRQEKKRGCSAQSFDFSSHRGGKARGVGPAPIPITFQFAKGRLRRAKGGKKALAGEGRKRRIPFLRFLSSNIHLDAS